MFTIQTSHAVLWGYDDHSGGCNYSFITTGSVIKDYNETWSTMYEYGESSVYVSDTYTYNGTHKSTPCTAGGAALGSQELATDNEKCVFTINSSGRNADEIYLRVWNLYYTNRNIGSGHKLTASGTYYGET